MHTSVDWPTLAVIAAFWTLFVAVVILGHHLPAALNVGVLAVLGALYTSLQHETIHGHPTASPRLNWLLSSAPLGVVLPLDRYRDEHLAHHAANLTEPGDDPESHYVSPEVWAQASRGYRLLLRVNRTMAGRLTVGPPLAWATMLRSDCQMLRGHRDVRRAWLLHLAAVAVLVVTLRVAAMPLWIYFTGFVFGGASLTALRSFVEHAAVDAGPRSAIVRTGWFFSTIFLNNNLHYTHHQLPGASWFRLPALSQTIDAERAAAEGAGVYQGYRDVARRYLFRSFGQPSHPLAPTVDR
jgi:fatty acid desaturase